MKIEKLTELGGAAPAAGDTFFKQANTIIENLRQLITLATKFRADTIAQTQGQGQGDAPVQGQDSRLPAKQGPNMLEQAISSGYGDVTIEQILARLGPLTLNQLKGVIDGTGPKK